MRDGRTLMNSVCVDALRDCDNLQRVCPQVPTDPTPQLHVTYVAGTLWRDFVAQTIYCTNGYDTSVTKPTYALERMPHHWSDGLCSPSGWANSMYAHDSTTLDVRAEHTTSHPNTTSCGTSLPVCSLIWTSLNNAKLAWL
jgi:hypothetical protein